MQRKKDMSRKLKIKIYKTVARPVDLHACEAWALNKLQQARLAI